MRQSTTPAKVSMERSLTNNTPATTPVQPPRLTAVFAILTILLAIGQTAVAQIDWQRDAQRAMQTARRTGKPLLVKVGADWCHYCRKMERETYSDSRIQELVSAQFIPLYVDGDRDKQLANRLGVSAFPTTVVVTPETKEIKLIRGFRPAEQFGADLQRLLRDAAIASRSDKLPTVAETGTAAAIVAKSRQAQHNAVPAAGGRIHDRNDNAKPSVFAQFCPVTATTDRQLTPGNAAISGRYRGYRLQFASEAHKEAFRTNPSAYWPVADGHCVVSAIEDRQLRLGQLQLGLVYEDQIWLFADQQRLQRFQSDPQKYVQQLRARVARRSGR